MMDYNKNAQRFCTIVLIILAVQYCQSNTALQLNEQMVIVYGIGIYLLCEILFNGISSGVI